MTVKTLNRGRITGIMLIGLFLAGAPASQGQILKKLGKRAEKAAERTVERRVDREVSEKTDQALDSILEPGSDGKAGNPGGGKLFLEF